MRASEKESETRHEVASLARDKKNREKARESTRAKAYQLDRESGLADTTAYNQERKEKTDRSAEERERNAQRYLQQ